MQVRDFLRQLAATGLISYPWDIMAQETTVFDVFRRCVAAVRDGKLIRRETQRDKEFHFQNWLQDRLEETGIYHEVGGSPKDFGKSAALSGKKRNG